MGIVTSRFEGFARDLLRQGGAEALPLVVVPHPVGGRTRADAEALVTSDVVDALVAALTQLPQPPPQPKEGP